MATNLLNFQAIGVRACATFGQRNDRRRSSSSNWWSSLFGWSSEPDYFDSNNNSNNGVGDNDDATVKSNARSEVLRDLKSTRSRFAPGSFTEKKARQLRMMTTDSESFHDVMYHSAIASRLASDFSSRSDQ
ncbi:hypothetical protein Nepgr_006331 [Nepenthes gracilis]|uniref:Uncharacterized protein n=1 Tax=Nepenthes gracilis TaxID=150966 RepID=A0AAD3S571_NEPGR|nr:hypothetical protein Nepgr_006331 [Nepenthes gracilis]